MPFFMIENKGPLISSLQKAALMRMCRSLLQESPLQPPFTSNKSSKNQRKPWFSSAPPPHTRTHTPPSPEPPRRQFSTSWKTTITHERDTNEGSASDKEQVVRCVSGRGPGATTVMARPADAGERQSRQWPPQINLSPVSTEKEASPGGKFPGHVNNFHSHSPSFSALVCVGTAVGPLRSRAHRPPSAARYHSLTNGGNFCGAKRLDHVPRATVCFMRLSGLITVIGRHKKCAKCGPFPVPALQNHRQMRLGPPSSGGGLTFACHLMRSR